jgi:protein-S-isoprenylcysteine O-methyltransferase Ste14
MFWLLAPGLFADPFDLVTVILFYVIGSIDILIRPVPEGKPQMDKLSTFIALLGFLQPFVLILAYYENLVIVSQFIPLWNNPVVAYIGITITIIAGIIMLVSRIQLGVFATPVLMIEDDHQLKTNGIYKFVRHPMYLGGVLMFLGTFLAFRSILSLIFFMVFYTIIILKRLQNEEAMLQSAFGEEYTVYMKKTKRLIPFIY